MTSALVVVPAVSKLLRHFYEHCSVFSLLLVLEEVQVSYQEFSIFFVLLFGPPQVSAISGSSALPVV